MARRAIEGGARVVGECTVTGIRTDDGRVRAVITDQGEVPADVVVSCAGIWGPRIGAMVGMATPLQPLAHLYAKTGPVSALAAIAASAELEDERPILRHQDRDLYFREHVDRMGIGAYGHRPLPVDAAALLSPAEAPVMPSVLEFTPEDFEESWGWAQELMPALRETTIEEGIDGVFSFTPDGFPLLGESRDVAGFWVAEAVWVTHSAGVARAAAEWLVDGAPSLDVHECDVNRFEAHQVAPQHVRDRGIQNFIEVYDVIHPLQPMEAPRPLRTSPFYEREQALGASFLEGSGWERPQWYEANAGLLERYGERIPERGAWAARYWSPVAGAEALATRDGVALYDMTSLKRIEVRGPGALAFLQRLTTNNLDRRVGSVVYTLLLEEHGGIRSDLTIARLEPDLFQVGANGQLDLDWFERHAPTDGSVEIRDVTSGTCCIGLWGPRARDVLAPLTGDDVSNEGFGYFRAKRLHVGHVPVTALRLSYVGELGWELYASADMGRKLWDTLWEAGPRARTDRRGPQRVREPAAGEGLPLVGHGHDHRARPVRGGARVRRADGQGRVRRPPRAGGSQRGHGRAPPHVPHARRSRRRRDGQGAGAASTGGRSATSRARRLAIQLAARSRTPGCPLRQRSPAGRSRSSISASGSPPWLPRSRCSIARWLACAPERGPQSTGAKTAASIISVTIADRVSYASSLVAPVVNIVSVPALPRLTR